MRESFRSPEYLENKDVDHFKLSDSIEEERGLFEQIRGKAKKIALLLSCLTAFAISETALAGTIKNEHPGESAKIEQAEKELDRVKGEVKEIFVLIQSKIKDPEKRKTAVDVLQSAFFGYMTTEEAAKTVIEKARMDAPPNLKELTTERQQELLKKIKELKEEINLSGDKFNDDGKYNFKEPGSFTTDEKAKAGEDFEEVEWVRKLGVANNPQLKEKYLKSTIEDMLK